MEMRHERRRTAARLLALDPDIATDLTQLRSRFVRRERAKEAAEKFRGGSGTNAQPLPTQSLLSNLGRARKSSELSSRRSWLQGRRARRRACTRASSGRRASPAASAAAAAASAVRNLPTPRCPSSAIALVFPLTRTAECFDVGRELCRQLPEQRGRGAPGQRSARLSPIGLGILPWWIVHVRCRRRSA